MNINYNEIEIKHYIFKSHVLNSMNKSTENQYHPNLFKYIFLSTLNANDVL